MPQNNKTECYKKLFYDTLFYFLSSVHLLFCLLRVARQSPALLLISLNFLPLFFSFPFLSCLACLNNLGISRIALLSFLKSCSIFLSPPSNLTCLLFSSVDRKST